MAKGRLIAFAVLAGGVAVEAAAPSATALLTIGDGAAGASLALAAGELSSARPRWAAPALAAALLWFIATLAGADAGTLADVGAAVVFVHRGAVLHLLLCLAGSAHWPLVVCGYGAAVLPGDAAGPATAAAALAVTVAGLTSARTGTARERPRRRAAALLAAALGLVWVLAGNGIGPADVLGLAYDLVLLLISTLAVESVRGGLRGVVGSLVVDLGPRGHADSPVLARLSRVLGDPDLSLRFRLPAGDWVDEAGRPAPDPDGRAATRAPAPGGGEVALLHGPAGVGEPALADAAARAAALALDTARLFADARREAGAVRDSRARLLSTDDAERRALEARLARGPLQRLERVDAALAAVRDPDVTALRREVDTTHKEIVALAAGLFGAGAGSEDFDAALRTVAARAALPVDVEVDGDLGVLSEPQRAAFSFVASEALANVAKHARASRAAIRVRADDGGASIEVSDDGIGGASLDPRGGLAGLADRIETLGGTLDVRSPPDGPTVVAARLRASAGEPRESAALENPAGRRNERAPGS